VPTAADIAHLLRRTGFGGDAADIATLAAQPLSQTVDHLLDFSAATADPQPAFLTDPTLGDWQREYLLQQWWLDRMATTTCPLQEKLALFWHGHFATENNKVGDMLLMYQQNSLFRHAGGGNFRDLVHSMSLQPAMLLYLDNDPNVVGQPNENFARELMELFTLGVDQYSQFDVEASARAWTGFNTLDSDREQFNFYPDRHDSGMKTFMGVTRDFDGPGIIDFILSENTVKKMTAARFIAKEVWTFFAYPAPEATLLDAITQAFYDSDLDVTTLLRTMFNRPEFYSVSAYQGLVRSPVEWVVALLRALGMTAEATNPQWWMSDMGQQLFEPPNVAGWKNNAYWLSTTALWARANFARYLTWLADNAGFLNQVPGLSVTDAVQAAFDAFGVDSPSTATRNHLQDWLTGQRAASDQWTDWQFINLITLTMLSPDFNLA
jgi:uncharacterized protein (DUF1800 family)